jgi:small subunit ribosomal protein S18
MIGQFESAGPRRSSSGPGGREGRPGGRGPRNRVFIKKTCRLCAEKTATLDYRDAERLRRFLTEKGKIIPRRITGNCAKCQRVLARVIKLARHAGVIAFQVE